MNSNQLQTSFGPNGKSSVNIYCFFQKLNASNIFHWILIEYNVAVSLYLSLVLSFAAAVKVCSSILLKENLSVQMPAKALDNSHTLWKNI